MSASLSTLRTGGSRTGRPGRLQPMALARRTCRPRLSSPPTMCGGRAFRCAHRFRTRIQSFWWLPVGCRPSPLALSLRRSFGGGKKSAGLIFRPGVTFVRCGKAVDSAGQCGGWCWNTQGEWSEADDKLCTWPPQHFGAQLHRLTDYQVKHGRLFYNEIIIDAPSWRSHLPGVIEGIYGDRELHRAFVAEYGLDEATFPLLHLDPMNWESPFSRA